MILTSNRKKILFNTTMFLLATIGVILALTIVGWIGRANAGTLDPSDPQSLALQLYLYIRAGAHLPAVGVALMLVVYGLRYGAVKLPAPVGPWFAGTLGGWVLGFGSAAILYVGTALAASQAITLGLITNALGVGFAASGKWEGLRDLWGYFFGGGAQPTMGIVKKAGAATIVLFIILSACSGCPGPTPLPVQDVVDCVKLESPAMAAASEECGKMLPNWGAMEACVVSKLPTLGWDVGGCVVAQLVQQYLSSKGAPTSVAQTHDAHNALEDYRSKYGHNATFKTEVGAL